VAALRSKAKEIGYEPRILDVITETNEQQPLKLVEILKKKIPGLKGKRVAILGLAFKADTDDVRETKAAIVVQKLLEEGASVAAYDPKAMENFKEAFPKIAYAWSAAEALKGSDACLILTDWDEFKNLADKDFDQMKSKIIIEGRKILDKNKVKSFEGICW
jgi:UDPglucose 6-dehydrogenase